MCAGKLTMLTEEFVGFHFDGSIERLWYYNTVFEIYERQGLLHS